MNQTADFGVAILGAGASSRMGRPKLLLPWGDTTILGHLVETWRTLGAGQIAVVCAAPAHDQEPMRSELDRLGLRSDARIVNPDPARGMFSSIQCAAQWAHWRSQINHLVLTLGDQPLVRCDTLRTLLSFAASQPQQICQPGRHGRARHPVVLPRAFFAELASATCSDLKQFLLARSTFRMILDSDDPGLDLDLDTPADYELARRLRGDGD